MEVVLAVMSVVGVGLTVSLLSIKTRQRSPRWPSLSHSLADASDSHPVEQQSNECPTTTEEDHAQVNAEADSNAADGFLKHVPEETSSDNDAQVNGLTTPLNATTGSQILGRQRRVMFVIAHPDDECMFFGPSILHFTQKEKAMVFLICLTNGSYTSSAIGRQRQQELWHSCSLLGIPAAHITLYRCSHLPDHPSQTWPVVNTAHIINKHLHTLACDMVVTFDNGGVSGHINHRCLHSSVSYLVEEHMLPTQCHAFCLDSVNIVRKYSSLLDLPLSLLCSSYTVTAARGHWTTIRSAMQAHRSQYVWFRKLYMMFSRYVLINTLTRLLPTSPRPPAIVLPTHDYSKHLLAASLRRRNMMLAQMSAAAAANGEAV